MRQLGSLVKGLEIDEIKKLGREAFEEAVGVWGQYADVDMATLEALAGKAKQVRRDLFEILFRSPQQEVLIFRITLWTILRIYDIKYVTRSRCSC